MKARVEVDSDGAFLSVRRESPRAPLVSGRRSRRLLLAAKRAVLSDAALRWRLARGGFRVDLRARQRLTPRLCLLHLSNGKEIPLYAFQRSGVARLLRDSTVLLADDMGLGKTIQVAAAIRALLASGRVWNAVVAAPATLLDNWTSELRKWVPELVVEVRGAGDDGRGRSWKSVLDQCHVAVTNYEQLRDSVEDDHGLSVDLLVLDEAHRIKNWDSQTSRAVRRITCEWKWALTGTPLERDSEDLANLLAFLDRDAFAGSDASLPPSVLQSRAARLVLRREKETVIENLPPVIRRHEHVVMEEEQGAAYAQAGSHRQGDNALVLFNRLRTICDYDPESGASVKVRRIVEVLRTIVASGEQAVVFSYILEPLRMIQRQCGSGDCHADMLEGAMGREDRVKTVQHFRDGKTKVLLASMRVASEGLTLVEANHVIFVNRWWNPSLNHQATDRVVRIGQHKTVFVYTFTVRNTIEEDLDRLLGRKDELFEQLIGRLSGSRGNIEDVLAQMRVTDG